MYKTELSLGIVVKALKCLSTHYPLTCEKWPVTCSQPRGGGVLGYKHDEGEGGPTEPNILHPEKYMDLILCTQKNT